MPQTYDRDSAILEINTIQKYIRTVTEDAGMQVQFRDDISSPMTDRNTVYIPRIRSGITKKDVTKLRHFTLHESLHHTKGPKAFDIAQAEFKTPESKKSPLYSLFNIVEDERIERAGSKEYLGDKEILNEGWQVSYAEREERIKKQIQSGDDNILRMVAAWQAELQARTDWCPSANEGLAIINNNMTPALQKYIDKTAKAGIVDKIRALPENRSGSKDAWELAKEMYELYFEQSAEEHLKQSNKGKPQPQPKGQGQQQQGQGKPQKGEQGEGQGQSQEYKPQEDSGESNGCAQSSDNKGQDGNDSGEVPAQPKESKDQEPDKEGESGHGKKLGPPDSGEPSKKPTGDNVDYDVFQNSAPTDRQNKGVSQGTGIHLDYTNYLNTRQEKNFEKFLPNPDVKVKYYRSGRKSSPELGNRGTNDVRGTYDKVINHRKTNGEPGKGFGNRVRQLLQVRSQAKYVGGQKKGKLHLKNLYRGGVPVDSYNERVFRQKHTNDTLDTCVTVLTDLSGSMGGAKVLHAIESAILLNESIARSLRIPVEILGFTDDSRSTIIPVIKDFDQQLSGDEVLKNFSKATSFMSANADGEAIQFAYQRLKPRKERRKILIVISDGSPACNRGGDIYAFTEKVIRQIEGEELVEIYAVGIYDETVKKLYKNHVVIQKADQLESAILTLIKKSILK